MSYDIAIFDPAYAPRERDAFLQWWDKQELVGWDPAVTTPGLRAWFLDMIQYFPAMNGSYASPRDPRAADYNLGKFLIYVAIWFDKQGTHERAFHLAASHHLGFFEPSSPCEIWLPGAGDALVLASKHSRLQNPKPITDARIAALVRSHPPGGSVVFRPAHAENPSRSVTVVYSSTDLIESLVGGPQGTLAEVENVLAGTGRAYAVVEEDEWQIFSAELHDALERLSEK